MPIDDPLKDLKLKVEADNKAQSREQAIRQAMQPIATSLTPISDKTVTLTEGTTAPSEVFERLNSGKYVAKFDGYYKPTGNEDIFARKQSGLEQIGTGVAKFGGKTLMYAADMTIGNIYGIASAIKEGSLQAYVQNDFSKSIDDINKRMDYKLPNYYSDEQKSMSLLRQVVTVNFWANDFLGGLAFVTGAVLPSFLMAPITGGASFASLGARAGFKLGAKTLGKTAVRAGVTPANATRIASNRLLKEGLTDGVKNQMLREAVEYGVTSQQGREIVRGLVWANRGQAVGHVFDTAKFLASSAGYEAGMEARHNFREAMDSFSIDFYDKNGRVPEFDEIQKFTKQAMDASNGVFLSNMAILAVSNAAMFGKSFFRPNTFARLDNFANRAIGLGITPDATGRLVLQQANKAQRALGNSYKILGKAFTEGFFEEGLQGVAGTSMQKYLETKYDPNSQEADSMFAFLGDALAEQYTTKEGLKEVLIGGLIGIFGGKVQGQGIAGFGKNSYATARQQAETFVKESNEALTSLGELAQDGKTFARMMSDASYAKRAAGSASVPSLSMLDTALHYMTSNEHLYSTNEMVSNYQKLIESTQLTKEQIDELSKNGLTEEDFKAQQIDTFTKYAENFNFAKSAADALQIPLGTFKNNKGEALNFRDAFIRNVMLGKDAADMANERLKIVANKTNVGEDVVQTYNQLSAKSQNLLTQQQEYLKERERLMAEFAPLDAQRAALQDKADPQVIDEKNTIAQQRLVLQQTLAELETKIAEVSEAIKDDLSAAETKTKELFGENLMSVEQMIDGLSKIDGYVRAKELVGQEEEAEDVRRALYEFKMYSDMHREFVNSQRKMSDANYFQSSEGQSLLASLIGPRYKMSKDVKEALDKLDDIVDVEMTEILESFGGVTRSTESVSEIVERMLEKNQELSEREKFRLESMVRMIVSKYVPYTPADFQEAIDQNETEDNDDGDSAASSERTTTTKQKTPIQIAEEELEKLLSKLEQVINQTNPQKQQQIKDIQERISGLEAQLQGAKTAQTTTQPQNQSLDEKKKEAEKIMSSEKTYDFKIKELIRLGFLTSIQLNGRNTDTVVYGGRLIHFMNINGKILPIYRSSQGTSGKTQGSWYPFFGFGNLYEEVGFIDVNDTSKGTVSTGSIAGYGDQGWLIKGTGSKDVLYNYEKGHGIEEIQYLQRLFNTNVSFSGMTLISQKQDFEKAGVTTNNTEQIDTKDRSVLEFNKAVFGKENLGVYNGDSLTRNSKAKFPNPLVGGITETLTPKEWIKSVVESLKKSQIQDISNTEYQDFVDNGNVSEQTLQNIAEKVKNNQQLTDRENAIFTDKTAEINNILTQQPQTQDNGIPQLEQKIADLKAQLEQKKSELEQQPTTSNQSNEAKKAEIERINKERDEELRQNLSNTDFAQSLFPAFAQPNMNQMGGAYIEINFGKNNVFRLDTYLTPIPLNGQYPSIENGKSKLEGEMSDGTKISLPWNQLKDLLNSIKAVNVKGEVVYEFDKDKINAKYNAELEALESQTQTQDNTQLNDEISNLEQQISEAQKQIEESRKVTPQIVAPQAEDTQIEEAPPTNNDTENGQIQSEIDQLKSELNSLTKKTIIMETPDYKRMEELMAITGRTVEQEDELQDLRTKMDNWMLVTGTVVEGIRLSDLVEQKVALENAKVQKLEEVEDTDVQKIVDIAEGKEDKGRIYYENGQTHDKVTITYKQDKGVVISGLREEDIPKVFTQQDSEGNNTPIDFEYEIDPQNGNIIIQIEELDKLNTQESNIMVRPSNSNVPQTYSILYQKANKMGREVWEPVSSTYTDYESPHNPQEAYNVKPEQELSAVIDTRDEFNRQVIAQYNSSNKTAEDLEELIANLRINTYSGNTNVSDLKAITPSDKLSEVDMAFIALRQKIVTDNLDLILDGGGKVITAKDKIVVKRVLPGHPTLLVERGSDGAFYFANRRVTKSQAETIEDVGVKQTDGKLQTRSGKTEDILDTTYLPKSNKKPLPFVVVRVGEKRIAYPVRMVERQRPDLNEFRQIFEANTLPHYKAIRLNEYMASVGLNVKEVDNAFIALGTANNLTNEKFEQMVAKIENLDYFYPLKEWLDLKIPMAQIIEERAVVNFDLNNPFHSPKITFTYPTTSVGNTVKNVAKGKTATTKNQSAGAAANALAKLIQKNLQNNC
jgi:hypothetical protein